MDSVKFDLAQFGMPYLLRATIHDIALSLSRTPRFSGLTRPFYSVAEHSVYVARYLDEPWALLHDAHEIVTRDIPKYVKEKMPQVKALEAAIDNVIAKAYDVPTMDVSTVDASIAWEEYHALVPYPLDYPAPPKYKPVIFNILPHTRRVQCWPPETARRMFLLEFTRLFST